MNGLNTEIAEKQRNPQRRKLSPEERERRMEIRRKRRRARLIKNVIAFGLCFCIIIGCIVIILNVFSKSREFENTNSGDFIAESDLVDETEQVYKSIPYYNEEYHERYMAFAEQYPEKTSDEVVWMVNANQDMQKYNYDILVTDYDDITIIVNKYYKVPDNYKPTDLTTVDNQQLRQPAAAAFIKMRNDALEENLKIQAVSGYRTVEYQKNLYNRYLADDAKENVDRYSARPGYSEHHTGLAVDIFGSKPGLREFENTPEYPWVRDNCYKYGFIIRYLEETEDITGYEAEPWHLRYVGVDISTDMKEKNINSYEEYYAKYLQ